MEFDIVTWTRFLDCREKFQHEVDVVSTYINSDTGGDPGRMTQEQLAASLALDSVQKEFSELKDMLYLALESEKISVRDLAGEYGDCIDWENE